MTDLVTASPPPSATLSDAAGNAAASAHRRIDLQSPADLFYLLNNARRAASDKIELHLPLGAALRSGAGEGGAGASAGTDEMRARVESRVGAFVDATFELAKRGVCVNGVEGEKVAWERAVPEEFEPYDHELASRIAAMHGTIEALNVSLANTRREVVVRAAREYRERFEGHSREVDATLATEEARAKAGAGGEGEADRTLLDRVRLGIEGREEEVSRQWEGALEALARLQSGLGETRDRAEGAEKVVSHLEGRT